MANLAGPKNINFPAQMLEYGLPYYRNVKMFGFKEKELTADNPTLGTLAYTVRDKMFDAVYQYVRPVLRSRHRLKIMTIFDVMKIQKNGMYIASEISLLISIMDDLYKDYSLESRIAMLEFLRR